MKLSTAALLLASHVVVAGIGFAAGFYTLPILIAPAAPTADEVRSVSTGARFTGEFKRDLKGSDALHWGEGTVAIGTDSIALMGRIAPGPDYKLYLSPDFVQTEAEFKQKKSSMVRVGDVKTFENFVVAIPAGIDPAQFSTVVVWCETFGQFITAARYR